MMTIFGDGNGWYDIDWWEQHGGENITYPSLQALQH